MLNNTNANYLKLLFSFKDLLFDKIFIYLSDPQNNFKNMDYSQLSNFNDNLLCNIVELYYTYKSLSSINNNNKLLNEEQLNFFKNKEYLNSYSYKNLKSHNIQNKNDVITTLNNINLNNIDFLQFIELFIFLWNIYSISNKELINKYINGPEIINYSLEYLNNLHLNYLKIKQSKDSFIDDNLHKTIFVKDFAKTIDKVSQFGINKRLLVKNLDEHVMVAKFSDSQIIKDKTEQNKIYALEISGEKLGLLNNPEYKSRIIKDKNNNIRQNLSVISSIIFTNKNIINNIDYLLFKKYELNNKNIQTDELLYIKALFDFNRINIKNIFIIEQYKKNNYQYPLFVKKIMTNSEKIYIENDLFINYFSLDDFCLFFATMHLEKLKKSNRNNKIKIELNEGINLNEDSTIDSDNLNSYFSKLIDLNNSIFIFKNCTWATVLENFYKYGIEISGGSTVKRHLLSPMNLTLSIFMNNITNNPYKDSVITTNLLEDSLYKSKFSKPLTNLYNKDKFKNIIETYISAVERENNDLISFKYLNLGNFENYKNPEFIYDLKYFILNNWVIRLDEEYINSYFGDINILNLHHNFAEVLESSLNNIQNSIIEKGEKKLKINKKEANILKLSKLFNIKPSFQKREYSTSLNHNISKILKIPKQKREYSTITDLKKKLPFNNLKKNIKNYSTLNNTPTNSLLELKNHSSSKITSNNDIFYQRIKELIDNSKYDPVLAQTKIEKNWIDILTEDLEYNDKNIFRNKINVIFKQAIETLNIKSFQKKLFREYGEFADLLVDSKLLFITLMVLIDSYQNSNHTMISYNVGMNITRKLYLNLNKSKNIITLRDFILLIIINKNIKITEFFKNQILQENLIKNLELKKCELGDIEIYNKINEFYISIGIIFIDIFIQEPINIFKLNYGKKKEDNTLFVDMNKPLKLNLTEEFENYISEIKENLLIQPKNIPMVCEPLMWNAKKYGGYILNKELQEDVITGSIKYHNHDLSGIGKIKLFKTINYFNQIKFGINNPLLNFLNNEGNYLFEFMKKDELNNSKISIKIAELFKDIPFYLNTHADWRGRIYTHCFYLSYQGSEIAKALLQFWDGFSLNANGLKSLYAYGATLYIDELTKNTIDERINWVYNNKLNILNMEPDFILKADSPILFAAFCLELKKLEIDPNVKIHIPVFIDATCSGIQHLSAMIAESELASLVNLTNNKSNNKPEDFYFTLVEPINQAINTIGNSEPDFSALKELYLDRKALKRPIMTQNYNVSIFGMKDQLFELLNVVEYMDEDNKDKISNIIGHSKEGKKIILTNKDLLKISMIIKEVIFIKFPVLKEIYDYFISIAMLMESLNLPVQWITPTGAIITQEYKKAKKKRIQIFLNKKNKVNVIRTKTNKIDFRKQKDGIIPNVIHSLDSAHIINLMLEIPANLESSIVTVHDCFGTHPNFIDILQFRLKEVFISLYVNNKFLKLFNKRLIQYIKDNNFDIIKEKKINYVLIYNKDNTINKLQIPIPPIKNSLDLQNIKNTEYMFN